MPKILIVETHCPDAAEAVKIAEAALEARLAAAANIPNPVASIFRWDGAIEKHPEVPVHLKTRPKRLKALTRLIKRLHSYHTPPILAREAEADAAYADWVKTQTEAPKGD